MPFSLETLPWRSKNTIPVKTGDETLIETFSTHWAKYLVPALLYMIIAALCIAGLESAQAVKNTSQSLSMGLMLISFIGLTIISHWFFHRILSEGMVDVIITSRRFIYLEANIWLKDEMHEISLDEIRAVQAYKKGLMQNILRYGSLWFDTGGTDSDSGRKIRLVPHPQSKSKAIMNVLKLK